MMDLSKKLASSDMISLTQIFAQQPRNSVRHLFPDFGKRWLRTYTTFPDFKTLARFSQRAVLPAGTEKR